MRIPTDPTRITLELAPLRAPLLESLRPGMVVRAVVAEATGNGVARLQIGSTQVAARTRLPLVPGTELTLQVTQGGELPELAVMRRPSPPQLQALVLKTALPRQRPLPQVLSKMRNAATRPASSTPLPPPVRTAIGQLLAAVTLRPERINSSEVRTAVKHSGVFLESQLAQNARSLATGSDLKAGLLRTLWQLRSSLLPPVGFAPGSTAEPEVPSQVPAQVRTPLPAPRLPDATAAANPPSEPPSAVPSEQSGQGLLRELLSQSEAALARIQCNQVRSLAPDDSQGRQIWQLDLPIQHPDGFDGFQLRLERETTAKQPQGESVWNLELRFDLVPLGPVQVQLRLRKAEISSGFLAQRQATAELIRRNFGKLREALERAGLQVGRLTSRTGEPADAPLLLEAPLLDEKA